MEGVSNEAASIAGTLGLGKLIYFYDDNHITIDGTTSISLHRGPRRALRGPGLARAARRRRERPRPAARGDRERAGGDRRGRRSSSSARTSHIRAPHAVDTAKAHGAPLGEDEVRATKEALGWDPDEKFFVPDEVREHMNVVERGIELEEAWQQKLAALVARSTRRFARTGIRCTPASRGPAGSTHCPEFAAGEEVATRDAGAKVMEAFKRLHADDDRRRRRPRRVDEDRVQGRRSLLARRTPAATSRSASASTRWARSSTGSRCTTGC